MFKNALIFITDVPAAMINNKRWHLNIIDNIDMSKNVSPLFLKDIKVTYFILKTNLCLAYNKKKGNNLYHDPLIYSS